MGSRRGKAAGTHAVAHPLLEHPPCTGTSGTRAEAELRFVCAVEAAVQQGGHWVRPGLSQHGLQAGDQRLQKEISSAAGGGQWQLRPRRAHPCQPLFPLHTQLPAHARLRALWNQRGKIIMFYKSHCPAAYVFCFLVSILLLSPHPAPPAICR